MVCDGAARIRCYNFFSFLPIALQHATQKTSHFIKVNSLAFRAEVYEHEAKWRNKRESEYRSHCASKQYILRREGKNKILFDDNVAAAVVDATIVHGEMKTFDSYFFSLTSRRAAKGNFSFLHKFVFHSFFTPLFWLQRKTELYFSVEFISYCERL